MGMCDCCKKSIAIIGGNNGSNGSRHPARWYGCSYHHSRGDTVCDNNHRAPMPVLDRAVIQAIEQMLRPEEIEYIYAEGVKQATRELKQNPDKPRELEAEARKLRRELERFEQLIAGGQAPETVLLAIRRREERLRELEGEMKALQPVPILDADIRRICREHVARFKDLLQGDVPVARQALRRLLIGKLRMSPVTVNGRRTLRFEGETTLGPLLDPGYKGWASPRGFEPRLPP
jgi:hypothetical protein